VEVGQKVTMAVPRNLAMRNKSHRRGKDTAVQGKRRKARWRRREMCI